MNGLVLFDPAVSVRLCLVLVHSLWQVALLAAVAWLVGRWWRTRPVEWNYRLYVAALVLSLVALPVTYTVVDVPTTTVPANLAATEPVAGADGVVGRMLPMSTPGAEVARGDDLAGEPAMSATTVSGDQAAGAAWSAVWRRAAPWLAGLYVGGVLVMLGRLAAGIIRVERLRGLATPITGGPLAESLRRLAERWSMGTVPALLQAEHIVVPKVVGLVKPAILFPTAAIAGLSIGELEMILAHELAHVRRYDVWINLLQRLAEVVLFFNPALWLLNRQISLLREYCCDELACGPAGGGDAEPRLRYAEALVRTVQLATPDRSRHSDLAALAAGGRSPSELRRRLARLFGEPLQEPVRLSRGGMVALGAVVLLLWVPALWPAKANPTEVGNTKGDRAAFITPGVGFGEYQIGQSTLEKILGEDTAENRRRLNQHGFSFEFDRGGELTAITFHLSHFTTAEGVGPGSTIDEMRKAYPNTKLLKGANDKFEYEIWKGDGIEFWPDGEGKIAAVRVSATPNTTDARKDSATISGKIVLEDGSPAPVKGELMYYSRFPSKLDPRNTSAASGAVDQFTDSFSCEIPAGTVRLAYYPDDYAPTWLGPFELAPGEQLADVTITLKPGFSEKLILEDEDGQRVPGATVVASPSGEEVFASPVHELKTDDQGELLLEHLAKMKYKFTITAPGYQPLRTAPLRVEPGEVLRPTMVRSNPALGIIRWADGTPAPLTKLRAIAEFPRDDHVIGYANEGEGFWGKTLATTDEHGRFSMDQLTEGSRYLFVIDTMDYARAIVDNLQAGQQNVQIVLPQRLDLVVDVKGDITNLPQRGGRPFISVRQPVHVTRPDGTGYNALVGGDVTLEPTPGGGQAIFRGLAIDLRKDAPQQTVQVKLGYDDSTRKTVYVSHDMATFVRFELPETERGMDEADGEADKAS